MESDQQGDAGNEGYQQEARVGVDGLLKRKHSQLYVTMIMTKYPLIRELKFDRQNCRKV